LTYTRVCKAAISSLKICCSMLVKRLFWAPAHVKGIK
jgi:hypothetical protein